MIKMLVVTMMLAATAAHAQVRAAGGALHGERPKPGALTSAIAPHQGASPRPASSKSDARQPTARPAASSRPQPALAARSAAKGH